MTKKGECNIKHDAKEKTKRFLQDFFTTIVDMEWHYRKNVENSHVDDICLMLVTSWWHLCQDLEIQDLKLPVDCHQHHFLSSKWSQKMLVWIFHIQKYGYSYQYISCSLDNFQSFILDRKSSKIIWTRSYNYEFSYSTGRLGRSGTSHRHGRRRMGGLSCYRTI